MRLFSRALALAALLLLPAALGAQERDSTVVRGAEAPAQARVPASRFALDVGAVSGALSYAHRVRGDWFLGAGVGAGGEFVNWMLVAGEHFAQDFTIAYERRDGAGEELLFEMASANLFARYEPSTKWHADLGLRGSVFLHFDDSDDDPGGGVFTGLFASVYRGWRHVKVGPRVLVGVFTETASTQEFGINLAPLTVRFTYP